MGIRIDPAHAATAIALQNACNPNGVLHTAWTISCEVTREYGTDAATRYAPLELTLYKLADLLHMPTSLESFERAYHKCCDARDSIGNADGAA